MTIYYEGVLIYIKSSKKIATSVRSVRYGHSRVELNDGNYYKLEDVRRVTIFEAFLFRIGQLLKWVLFQFFPNY